MGYPVIRNPSTRLEQWRDDLRKPLSGTEIITAIEEWRAQETDLDRVFILDHFLAQEHTALGNRAAAEAIRARSPDLEIHRWHDEWRDRNPEADVVLALEERIRGETHPRRLHTARWLLAEEHQLRGNYLAAEAVYLADAAEASPTCAKSTVGSRQINALGEKSALHFC
jgi:hypothetical protein